ncbi:DUF1508 domain-containing protein [Tsukamurella sp. 1534]|uniref:YegP family protein n=1 Tax=Tsukamurella sp. 1534 TaxID=1151061 RepID=UPI00059501BB|nr:DUF1508 domain-containing protein [Tsukamurella sp. 1534]
MGYRFTVSNAENGQATWRLHAGNNEMVAWAGETFASFSNARRAASDFKTGAKYATYDVYLDAGNEWRWRAVRGGRKVAASGESFANRANAERASANVRDNAGGAKLD